MVERSDGAPGPKGWMATRPAERVDRVEDCVLNLFQTRLHSGGVGDRDGRGGGFC